MIEDATPGLSPDTLSNVRSLSHQVIAVLEEVLRSWDCTLEGTIVPKGIPGSVDVEVTEDCITVSSFANGEFVYSQTVKREVVS